MMSMLALRNVLRSVFCDMLDVLTVHKIARVYTGCFLAVHLLIFFSNYVWEHDLLCV